MSSKEGRAKRGVGRPWTDKAEGSGRRSDEKNGAKKKLGRLRDIEKIKEEECAQFQKTHTKPKRFVAERGSYAIYYYY